MECMCAQTRPRFILSSERVLGEWSQNPCYLQGKNPLYWGNNPPQSRIKPMTLHHAGQRAQHTTNLAIPAPQPGRLPQGHRFRRKPTTRSPNLKVVNERQTNKQPKRERERKPKKQTTTTTNKQSIISEPKHFMYEN